MLLYVVFHSVTEAAVLIFPTIYALTGGLILQKLLGYNFSVAVWVGYMALFGIAVETGVVMVVYLHEVLDHRLKSGVPLRHEDIEAAVIEGAVHRLRPRPMTVCVVLASLIPILWETGVVLMTALMTGLGLLPLAIGSGDPGREIQGPMATIILGGLVTSTLLNLLVLPSLALRYGIFEARRESSQGG
jgi:Cu(I)/Ag(I) efflux system membrane protein CusA/SilA